MVGGVHAGPRQLHREVLLRRFKHNVLDIPRGRGRFPYTFATKLVGVEHSIAVNKLLILAILQLGMSGAILYVLLDRDSEPQAQKSEQPSIGRAETVQEVRPVAKAATVDAESIRQIVRSELFEFAAQFPDHTTGQEADASDIDPLERDARLSEARERLALYRAVGEISDREIDEFQRNISTLDLASQKAVLSELFREINAGNVKVRP